MLAKNCWYDNLLLRYNCEKINLSRFCINTEYLWLDIATGTYLDKHQVRLENARCLTTIKVLKSSGNRKESIFMGFIKTRNME